MDSSNKTLTIMDVLDLEESLIDEKLKVIMTRKSLSNRHLISALELLKYKQLINVKESSECDNEEEYDFIVNLIKKLEHQNVDYVCEIVKIVLSLNVSSMVSKAEHLLQQLLLYIDLKLSSGDENDVCEEFETTAYLKLCDSILDSILENGQKIDFIFFDIPLENILQCQNDSFKAHFFIHTVQKMYDVLIECNILDIIWNYLILETEHKDNALNILCQLSDFYLPTPDYRNNIRFVSNIVSKYEFWNILQFGLLSNSTTSRKTAVFLAKKAIDFILHTKDDISVTLSNTVIFQWDYNNARTLKSIWNSYFVLIESLEEKQSTIVIPSLNLFEQINCIPDYWLKCLFKLGLEHDNLQVRFTCIKHRVLKVIDSETDALILLNALNDLSIFNEEYETEVKQELVKLTDNHKSLTNIMTAITQIKWSPVPLYHITDILASSDISKLDSFFISQTIVGLLNIPCNHIVIRKASYKNIIAILAKNCECVEYLDYLNIINSICKHDILNYSEVKDCKLYNGLTNVKTSKKENSNDNIIDFIVSSEKYIGFGLFYLKNHPEDMEIFLSKVRIKFITISDIIKRQYCDRRECLKDFLFVLNLSATITASDGEFNEILNCVSNGYELIWQYVIALLSSDCILNLEEIMCIWKGLKSLYYYKDAVNKNVLLVLNNTCYSLLREKNMDINKQIFCVCLISIIISNVTFKEQCDQDIPDLNEILKILTSIKFNQTVSREHDGRMRGTFYERSCELISIKVMQYENQEIKINLKELVEFVEKGIDSGSYGCLQWILKIINKILPDILSDEYDKRLNFNTIQFINRMWKEIEELKFNNLYSICIKEFVILINQDCLLETSSYNNIILLYCNKIIEQGSLKKSPLYFLINEINTKQITLNLGPLVYVIGEILLFAPILRKDQRITDKLSLRILNNPQYGIDKFRNNIHFNFDIEYIIIETLSKISKADVLNVLSNFIMKKINDEFINKTRYHCNSLAHNILLKALQHLLFMLLLEEKSIDLKYLCQWCFKLLNKLPHQPNVRVCLEWSIALCHLLQKSIINKGLLEKFENEGTPIISQFHILNWMLKYKINSETCGVEEYEFVMDNLMSHTMRQIFNTRLNAQYFAVQMYNLYNKPDKYGYTINIIKNNFIENDTEKNYIKLQQDYFANDFDIIGDLTPCFIYYGLPKYSESNTQFVDENNFKHYLDTLNTNINVYCNKDLLELGWKKYRKQDMEIFKLNWNTNLELTKIQDDVSISTIQKKYIPWRNMLDVDVYQDGSKTKEKLSKLIVVVSLIDKLPNLGGMARTSEVFGVKTYVVDSLRHLQDKQFQSVSVSAERWLDVEEIRPGSSLKKYLIAKKSEGYSIVAAEQTSTSVQLQSFKFPENTLILLGHEREGIPCDLLPLMDYCVEIPQQGFVRSLNVHVTASIFIWEYSRQNMLQ